MELRQGQIDNLLTALSHQGFALPYMASVRDHPNVKDLQAADEEAWEQNRKALREALRVV